VLFKDLKPLTCTNGVTILGPRVVWAESISLIDISVGVRSSALRHSSTVVLPTRVDSIGCVAVFSSR